VSLALIFRPLTHCSPRGRGRAYKEYWHAPLTFETTPGCAGYARKCAGCATGQDGGQGLGATPARYARYLPKNVKIFCQPSTAASGRYAGRFTEKKACPAPS